MAYVAIMGNGPVELIPDLSMYKDNIDVWIGADKGALTLIEHNIPLDYAVGDFDSINDSEKAIVKEFANSYKVYPSEKDQTDLEIALSKAYELQPQKIYLFGVTGGRLDHALINIQLLYSILNQDIRGIIIDNQNKLELTMPGRYIIEQNNNYPNISFIPYTQNVKCLTLEGFYYPLVSKSISWGSTLCISNKLLSKSGTFSYKEGILLLIKSRDAMSNTIPM